MTEAGQEGLIHHLVDLRKALVKSLIFIGLGFCICVYWSEYIFDFIRTPIEPYLDEGGLVFTAPMDKFTAYLKVSFLAGMIITCPFWLYQVWSFIAPGLYKDEKKWSALFIFFGTFLFIAGVAFVYNIVYPMAFDYLMNFGGTTDRPMITIKDYIGFFILTTLVFGLAFELPLILVMLGALGIVSHEMLKAKRRYAIVIMAVLAAVATPPDAISQIAMLVPLTLLYELAVWLVYLIEKSRAKAIE